MRRHLGPRVRPLAGPRTGSGAIDLRLVETGLDHRAPRLREGRLLVLSGASRLGTPPIASNALVWAPTQSASAWLQLASAHGPACSRPEDRLR